MHDKGISFYIINTADPHFSEYIDDHFKIREYMSGFSGSAGTLVVSKDEAALFVDGRYYIQADIETKDSCINVYKLGMKEVPSISDYLLNKVSEDTMIGFDGRCFSQYELERLIKKLGDLQYLYEDNLVEYAYDELPKMNCSRLMYLPLAISGESITDKLAKIRLKMKELNSEGYFLSALDDIMWLFNIRGRDIKYNTTAYAYAYITEDSATLYVNDDALNISLNNGLESEGVIIANYDEIEIELCKLKGKAILLDKAFTSCYFYKIIDTGNNIISVNNYEIIKKYIKNKTECENAKKHSITDAVTMIKFIKNIKEDVKLGIEYTEYEMARFLDGYRSNAKDFYSLSFDTIVAYNENAAIVHYSPDKNNSKTIEDKGFLLVDSGAHYIGATTDITRTIAFNRLTQDEKNAYTYVLKSNLALMSAKFLEGTSCEALDILAREPLWKLGLDYMHGTGHGIGSF